MPMQDVELLRAALAVAMADGTLSRGEKGVVQGLAQRVGIGRVSFDAMMAEAERSHAIADNILIHDPAKARAGLELLVATARIDGAISDKERELLTRLATTLKISPDEFGRIYEAGIRRADEIRAKRARASD